MTLPHRIREADLDDAGDARAVVEVLDPYRIGSRPGGGVPLTADVRLAPGSDVACAPDGPGAAGVSGDEAVGLSIGFWGISSFRASPLSEHPRPCRESRAWRGKGVGRALLAGAEERARERGCCKLTLEVQDDNTPARILYERFGFQDVIYGNSGPTPIPETRCLPET